MSGVRNPEAITGSALQQRVFLKNSQTQVLFCEISEIFRNSYFEEYLQTTASINKRPLHSVLNIPEYALAEFCLFLRFLICQDSAYGRVLNMQDLYMVLNMSQYG